MERFVKLFARCRAPGDRERQQKIADALLVEGKDVGFQAMLKAIGEYTNTPASLIDQWCERHNNARDRRFVARLRGVLDSESLWKVLQAYGDEGIT